MLLQVRSIVYANTVNAKRVMIAISRYTALQRVLPLINTFGYLPLLQHNAVISKILTYGTYVSRIYTFLFSLSLQCSNAVSICTVIKKDVFSVRKNVATFEDHLTFSLSDSTPLNVKLF